MFEINFSSTTDAIDMLRADHAEVDAMFKEYDAIKDTRRDTAKADLVGQICAVLSLHATIDLELLGVRLKTRRDEGLGGDTTSPSVRSSSSGNGHPAGAREFSAIAQGN